MAKSFTPAQQALAASSSIKPITMVVVTTYSDRALGTVDKVYPFSDRPVLYDIGNTGTVLQFEPAVLAISDLEQSIPHVPGTQPAGLEAEIWITLSNLPYQGGHPLIRELRAHNLEFATVEISTVYGIQDSDTGWYDLRAYTGDEHIVDFRGEVEMAEGIDAESFQLRVKTPEVTLSWLRAQDATITDPKDLGSRLPAPYGHAKRVPCINWQVGWATTLSSPLTSTAGVGALLDVTDATGFPIAAFTCRLNGEELVIAARAAAADPLLLTSRAQSTTTASEHAAGSTVVELPDEAIVVVADCPVYALNALYLRNPYSDTIFRVPTLPALDLADTVTVPGSTVSTLTFSQDDLRALLDAAFRSAEVSQQPDYSTEGPISTQVAAPNGVSGDLSNPSGNASVPQFSSTLSTFNGSPSSPRWTGGGGSLYQHYRRFTVSGFPNKPAISIELYGSVEYNTIGLTHSGPAISLRMFRTSIPYLPVWSQGVPDNFSGTVALSTGPIQTNGYNFSAVNGGFLDWIPIAQTFGTVNSSKYIGLSTWGLRVTYQDTPTVTRTVDARIEAASVGYGLDFYADVDGPAVPTVYADRYSFDTGTGWSTSGCTASADTAIKAEGTGSLKLVATESVVDTCESLTDWAAETSGAASLSIDSSIYAKGSGSIKVTTVATGTNTTRGALRTNLTAVDTTNSLLAFDIRVDNLQFWRDHGLTSTTGFALGLSSTTGFTADYIYYWFGDGTGLFVDGAFVTVIFDPAAWPTVAFSGGSPVLSSIRSMHFAFIPTITTVTAGEVFRIDNIRTLPKYLVAQRNATTGAVDLTATPAEYRVRLRATQAGEFGDGHYIAFSNTAGSGTTLPADFRQVSFGGEAIGAGEFEAFASAAVDTGSPGVNDVETIRVQITVQPTPSGVLIDVPTLWIDDLEARDDTGNPYSVAVGELIERPADVLGHLLLVRAGLASSYVDVTTFGAWVTNAPDLVWAFDLRTLGETFPEIVARLGYEGRANLIRAEGASSSVYKALAAESDYTWPASSGNALTVFQDLSEVGRDGRELATRFQFAYARDLSIGSDLSAYTALVRADPDVSDVSVSAGDLATREQRLGRRDADLGALLCTWAETTAQEVAGYYVSEAGRAAGTFLLSGCAWWEAAAAEVGDLFDLAPTWHAGTIKVRVIEVVKKWTGGVVDLRAVEVE